VTAGGPWTPVGSLAFPDITRKFGDATGLVVNELAARALDISLWALDRKVFRRIVRDNLPPGHAVTSVLERRPSERSVTAARAFARLKRGFELTLDGPAELAGQRCLLWSSWALRPREMGKIELEFVALEFEELEQGMWDLWSRVYLGSRLARVPLGARKLDVSLGLAVYSRELEECLSHISHLEHTDRLGPFRPIPSFPTEQALLLRAEQELYRSLGQGFSISLAQMGFQKRAPNWLWSEPGALWLRPFEPLEKGLAAASKARAIELVFGAEGPERVSGKKSHSLTHQLSLGTELLLRARNAASVETQVERLAERVRASQAWLQELDLAVLPDDGLRRTLEELSSLWQAVTELAANAELLAAIHIADYRALTGLSLGVIDAGLPLPLLTAIEDFEEAMSRVRSDPLAQEKPSWESPESGSPFDLQGLGEGPARRALTAFVAEHRELWGEAGLEHPALAQLVARAFAQEISVRSRMNEAAAAADRDVARFEEQCSRVVAASLAAFRTQTRATILLRERTRSHETIVAELFRQTLADVDRRLPRLEPGLASDSAYHAGFDELVRILDLRGENLAARVLSRKRELELAGRGGYSQGFVGLAERRFLPSALALAYRGAAVNYRGRATDSVPTLARALGVDLAWA
jgi:hypothetical protein